MGALLLYILASLYLGEHQNEGWHNGFVYIGAGVLGCMIVDGLLVYFNQAWRKQPIESGPLLDTIAEKNLVK